MSVDPESRSITIAFVEVFRDEEANEAAREDGVIGPGEQLPNPMYVRDTSVTGTLELSRHAYVTLLITGPHGSPEPSRASVDELADAVETDFADDRWYGPGLFHIGFRGGLVVSIRQIYTP